MTMQTHVETRAEFAPELERLRAELVAARGHNRALHEQWQEAQEEAAQRTKVGEVVRRITARLAEQPELNAFFESFLLEACELLHSAAGRVILITEGENGGRFLTRLAHVTDGQVMDEAWMDERGMVHLTNVENFPDFERVVLELSEPSFFDLNKEARWRWPGAEWSRAQGHRSIVMAPLRCGERNIGCIGFRFRHDKSLATREMAFIEGLALQASLAVQMSRLAQEQQSAAQSAAVLNERNRMAREIHDTLAQTLTGVVVQTEAAARAFPDAIEVGEHLAHIASVARQGLQEARRSVSALRPAPLDGGTSSPSPLPSGERNESTGQNSAPDDVYADALDALTHRSENALSHSPAAIAGETIGAGESALELQQLQLQLSIAGAEHRALREQWEAAQDDATQKEKVSEVVRRTTARLAEQLGSKPIQLDSFFESLLLEACELLHAVAGRVVVFTDEPDGGTLMTLIAHITDGQVMDEAWMAERGMVRLLKMEQFSEFGRVVLDLKNPGFFDNAEQWRWPGAQWSRSVGHRSLVLAPMRCAEQPLGFIGFMFRHDTALAARDMASVEGLALQASLALQMSRLAGEQQRAAQVAAVLDERNRMAREIHDTLAQTLTGVIMQTEAARRALPDAAAVTKHLARIGSVARAGLQEARRGVRALRPALLDGSTLALALAALCEGQPAASESGTRYEFAVKGEPRPLPPEVEDTLLRVTQEALVNVARHAGARKVWVELRFGPEDSDGMQCICLRVQDDGRGFDVEALEQQRGGFGLVGMHERVAMRGGTLDISSRPGQGSEIRAGISLPAL